MSALLAPIEPYLWAALAVLAIGGGLYMCHRLEAIGANNVRVADAAAREDERNKAAAETARLQIVADKAAGDRDAAQKSLTTYMSAHPVGSIFVCHGPANSGRKLPPAPGANPGASDTGTGSSAVPPVLTGSDGADIGPALAIIVQAAGAVSGNLAEFQKRSVK